MIARVMRYFIWITGTLIALRQIGIDLSNIAMVGSALAVGLGFGLQNIVSNFVSGVIILLDRSLKAGDFIELESGIRGNVREIAMRYTRVCTNDSLDILVPNSEFINGRVTNWTHDNAYRRMHIPFGIAYGTPKEKVAQAAAAAARKINGIISDHPMEPQTWLVSYGDNAVNYELVVWADHQLTSAAAAGHARLMWALDDKLQAAGIEISFPQRDLHFKSGAVKVELQKRRAASSENA